MYSKGFSLIDFIDQFHAEEDCQDYLFLIKHGDFPYCQKCESKRVNKISTRGYGYYCLSCGHQFSVIKGTLFENTKIPLRKWFLAIYLMTIDKRGISALDLSRKINTTHRTAMVMLKNLRKLMVDNDGEFILEDVVEIDEFFIGASGGVKQVEALIKPKYLLPYLLIYRNLKTRNQITTMNWTLKMNGTPCT